MLCSDIESECCACKREEEIEEDTGGGLWQEVGVLKGIRPKDASLILLGLRFEYPKLNNHFFFGASGHGCMNHDYSNSFYICESNINLQMKYEEWW